MNPAPSTHPTCRRNNSEFTRTLPTTQELDEDATEEDDADKLEGAIFMVATESGGDMRKDEAAATRPKDADDGTSFASSGSTEDSSGDLPTPPDGGWGWVVVFASFMIHFMGMWFYRITKFFSLLGISMNITFQLMGSRTLLESLPSS